MSYRAPLKDMLFCMKELAGLEAVSKLPAFEEAGLDTAQAVLEESARLNEDVIAPLNRDGDTKPSSWKDGIVTTTPPYDAISRECTRSYSTPMHRNIAPETKPWLIICTRPPDTPSSLKTKKPSVTKPMCATDEYATSFFMSRCTSATRPRWCSDCRRSTAPSVVQGPERRNGPLGESPQPIGPPRCCAPPVGLEPTTLRLTAECSAS